MTKNLEDLIKMGCMNNWSINGSFNEVIDSYYEIDSATKKESVLRRKNLFRFLEKKLLLKKQEGLLKYAMEMNKENNLLIFENGGTFGYFMNNFAGIIYADAVSQALKDKGKPAITFTIIDPSDVSRAERTLLFAGKKFKMPLPVKNVGEGLPTNYLPPLQKEEINKLFENMKKEVRLYFDLVLIKNNRFKGRQKQREEFNNTLNSILQNLRSVNDKFNSISSNSNNYNDFTNKILSELIGPLTKNSVFLTLKDWQANSGIKQLLSKKEFYEKVNLSIEKTNKMTGSNFKILKTNKKDEYVLPFRINDGKNIYKKNKINLKTKEVIISDKQTITIGFNEVIKNSTLLPYGGILYAIDSYSYDAIPLASAEPRVFSGYLLGGLLKKENPKPFLTKDKVPFISLGRMNKKSSEVKLSGALGAAFEGLDSDYIISSFKTKDKDFKIESKIYKKYGQPSP